MEKRYCLLFESDNEKIIEDKKYLIRITDEPTLYDNKDQTHTLFMDRPLETDFINKKDYEILFEGIIRILTEPEFYANGTYKNYYMSNISIEPEEYVTFIFQDKTRFFVATSIARFKKMYPITSYYYVVHDEDNTVNNNEMLSMIVGILNQFNKEGRNYTDVLIWDYIDDRKKDSFYVLYSGDEPSVVIIKDVIRNYLINYYRTKYHLSENDAYKKAKQEYPLLFIDSFRKIYVMYDNTQFPINVENLNTFIDRNNILMPEVIYCLDWVSPLIIEYGISELIPDFVFYESENIVNNKFLYYISNVLNYYENKVIDKNFIKESHFVEYEDYCSVVCAEVEWQIMKQHYNNNTEVEGSDIEDNKINTVF